MSISSGLLEYFVWNLILLGSVREVRAGVIFEGRSWCLLVPVGIHQHLCSSAVGGDYRVINS